MLRQKIEEISHVSCACSIRPGVRISMGIALQRSSAKVEGSLRLLTPWFRVSNSRIFLVPHASKRPKRFDFNGQSTQIKWANSFLLNLKPPLSERKSQANVRPWFVSLHEFSFSTSPTSASAPRSTRFWPTPAHNLRGRRSPTHQCTPSGPSSSRCANFGPNHSRYFVAPA